MYLDIILYSLEMILLFNSRDIVDLSRPICRAISELLNNLIPLSFFKFIKV